MKAVRTSEANIPWLTSLPNHWRVVRSKGLFSARKERAYPDDVQLSATQAYGVIPQKEFEQREGRRVVQITQHLDKRAHVEKDDFVISMRSFQGGLERAWSRGCIRSSYVVLKPSREVHVGFFAHLFKSHDYVSALQATANFIRDGQDLNMRNFSLVDLPLIPFDEQATIAAHLDHATGRIEQAILAKRRLVALLKEQKAAFINHAVTCGLNLNAPLKPSGIPWLPEIPMHWEVKKIIHLARVGNGSTPSRGNMSYWTKGSYPWLNSSVVNQGNVTAADQFVTEKALAECHLPRVQPDSVLVAITGQGKTRGMAALLSIEATINQHLAYIKLTSDRVSPRYLLAVLTGLYSTLRAISDGEGSTKGALTCDDLKHLKLPLPPVAEQVEILKRIEQHTLASETAIAAAEREIALMEEYRTALISAAVTGKIDVRQTSPAVVSAPRPNRHFARALLSAEIVHQLHIEPTFGRIKHQKILHLCEFIGGIEEIQGEYHREAAGPLDNKLIYSVETELKKQKWFEEYKRDQFGHGYRPLAKAGGHRTYVERYWKDKLPIIERLIKLMRTWDTERCEIFSTAYAAWNDLLLWRKPVTDDAIVHEILNRWHDRKRQVPESRWRKALDWMRKEGYVPTGFGRPTAKCATEAE